jgi:hypothetical protein
MLPEILASIAWGAVPHRCRELAYFPNPNVQVARNALKKGRAGILRFTFAQGAEHIWTSTVYEYNT